MNKMEWISVKDRLPEETPLDRPPVLIWVNSYYRGKGGYDLAIRMNGKWVTVKSWDLEDSDVDYWQELTKPTE